MKVWRVYRPLHCLHRCASTHWRHVESPPPIPLQKFKNKAPPNSPTMNININSDGRKKAVDGKLKYRKDGFASPTSEGAVLKYDGELYELLKNPVADKSYQLLCQVKDHGFVQNREHLKNILVENSPNNRFLMKGENQCGKTMSCYAILISYMKKNYPGLIVPALHLAHWFQDTPNTQLIHTDQGMLDFPEINANFLRFFVACNTYSESPNKDVLSETLLLEDERWTSNIYSFKGDSLLNAAKIGISTPPIAGHVTQVILSTILEREIPSVVIADNANLLCEIHSSKMENLRNLEAKDWWNQPPLIPEKITLLRTLKEFITLHERGQVILTVDPQRDLSDRLIAETGNIAHNTVQIPNTPSEKEYLQFLNHLRKEEFISRNMSTEEVTELTYLTGRSYVDTLKYMFMI